MERSSVFPSMSIQVERRQSALRVIARTDEPGAMVRIEAMFSGENDGIWFRLVRDGETRVFSHDLVSRHPALSAVLRLVADEIELSKPTTERLLTLLFQSLIVYVSRMTVAEPLPKWGRPIRDRRIEKALTLLNEDLSKRWTVDLLARAVGLSRPAFAKLFVRVLRLTPMRYLTQRRMLAAAALLLESDAALAEVACRIGYASEFAFSRAFKRHYRVSPGVYRQRSDAVAIAQPIQCRMAA